MKLFKNLTLLLTIFFCVSVSSRLDAKILWERELVSDANTNSTPFASCLNKNGDGIFVLTVECPKNSLPVLGGDCVLWEVGINGTATRTEPKDANGSKIWANGDPAGVGFGCAMIGNNFGDILTIGILNKSDAKRQKIAVISKADKAKKMTLTPNSIESHSIKKTIILQDNTFVLVGERNYDGLCVRFDHEGRTMKEKLFDLGETEIFSGVEQIKSANANLAVVGLSANLSMKDYHKNYAKSFILIYDPNLNLVHEDYFANENSVSMFSLVLQPKVCCLNNGNIVVLYKKVSTDPNKTSLTARCYTKELKVLWEKEILSTNRIFAFDIISNNSGFLVAAALNNLELYSFSDDGTKTNYIKYNDNSPGIPGFNLMHVNGKILAVFEEGITPIDRKWNFKAKVIALD